MIETTGRPTRDEFIAFWEKHTRERTTWRALLPNGIFILGAVLYAMTVRLIDGNILFWFAAVAGMIACLLGVPYICIRNHHKRYATYLRCSQCGDWPGRDITGDWHGPNPRWVYVGQTGHVWIAR